MDAVIFLFSFTDKSSFDDLPQHMTRVLNTDENFSKFVFGTKYPLLIYMIEPVLFIIYAVV